MSYRFYQSEREMMVAIARVTQEASSVVDLSLEDAGMLFHRAPFGIEIAADPECSILDAMDDLAERGPHAARRARALIMDWAAALDAAHIDPPPVVLNPGKELLEAWHAEPGFERVYNRLMHILMMGNDRLTILEHSSGSGALIFVADPLAYPDGWELVDALSDYDGPALVLLRSERYWPDPLANFHCISMHVGEHERLLLSNAVARSLVAQLR